MDDTHISRARDELTRLERRESELLSQLEIVRLEAGKLTAFLEVASRYQQGGQVSGLVEAAAKSRPTPREGTKGAALVEAALAAIRKAGHPLSIGELVEAVTAAGLAIGGQREGPNLAGFLSRSDLIVFRRGVGWSEAAAKQIGSVGGKDASSAPTLPVSGSGNPPGIDWGHPEQAGSAPAGGGI